MPKYIANPVEVDAFVIKTVCAPTVDNLRHVWIADDSVDGGEREIAVNSGLTARYVPVPGDYYVIQSDGYAYLNPKDVFERKYSPKPQEESAPEEQKQAA